MNKKGNRNIVERKHVKIQVENHFNMFFTEYIVPEEIIESAVDDVFECSAIKDEGYYGSSDVSIACQRALLKAMNIDF